MATNILENIDPRSLGELLEQARKKCGMTQADAAKVIDVSRTTMVAIEKGERRLKAIVQGLLKVVDFESEEEVESFVNYAAILGDDGESASCAIATDDKSAIKFIQQTAPHIQVVSTPEIIKHWSDVENINSSTLRNVLQAIRLKARYSPPNNHPLKNWWTNTS